MKKLAVILLVMLLCGCSAKREDFYSLSFDGHDISVGYDGVDLIRDLKTVDAYGSYLNDKDEEILNKLVVYTDDLDDPEVTVDGYKLVKGIKETCKDLDGELIENNGFACLIGKEVKGRENYIIIYGDILDDDINRIDRIEVYYDFEGN